MGSEMCIRDSVEGAGLERKRVYVRLAEVEPRVQPACKGDHRPRDVHSNHGCAVLGRSRRHITGAGGEIEQPRFGADGDCIQERLDESACDAAEEVVIARRLVLPTSCLEGVEGIGIDSGLPHSHTLPPPQHPGTTADRTLDRCIVEQLAPPARCGSLNTLRHNLIRIAALQWQATEWWSRRPRAAQTNRSPPDRHTLKTVRSDQMNSFWAGATDDASSRRCDTALIVATFRAVDAKSG